MVGMAPPLLVVTRTKGHMGWDEPESDPASRPAAQWQAPDRLTLDRTEVTGKYDWRCFQNTDALASKPKRVACATLFEW